MWKLNPRLKTGSNLELNRDWIRYKKYINNWDIKEWYCYSLGEWELYRELQMRSRTTI